MLGTGEVKRLETLAYRLFAQDDQSHEQLFADWVAAIGSVYPVISFLVFLKDAERYIPLRPEYLT
jgi:hypothetical protein